MWHIEPFDGIVLILSYSWKQGVSPRENSSLWFSRGIVSVQENGGEGEVIHVVINGV